MELKKFGLLSHPWTKIPGWRGITPWLRTWNHGHKHCQRLLSFCGVEKWSNHKSAVCRPSVTWTPMTHSHFRPIPNRTVLRKSIDKPHVTNKALLWRIQSKWTISLNFHQGTRKWLLKGCIIVMSDLFRLITSRCSILIFNYPFRSSRPLDIYAITQIPIRARLCSARDPNSACKWIIQIEIKGIGAHWDVVDTWAGRHFRQGMGNDHYGVSN